MFRDASLKKKFPEIFFVDPKSDAEGGTPRHAGSGPRAGGLGGAPSPPAGFATEPRKLINLKQFGSRWIHLRASKNGE